MKEHPSIKTKIFTNKTNNFIISNITIKTSPFINTLRLAYNDVKSQQQIVNLFEKYGVKASLETPTNYIVVTEHILQALKILKENTYISPQLADEVQQYYMPHLKEIYTFAKAMLNQEWSHAKTEPSTESKIIPQISKSSKRKIIKNNYTQERILELYKKRITKVAPLKPRYQYEGENSINPAYTNIENSDYLCRDEKRIFVLRSDFILATGIKNVCINEGNTDIFQKTDSMVHSYINKNDRYGHPSLAQPDSFYDGSVYYAGWLCQRSNHIKVFLQSGRFHNSNLTDLEKIDIEFYIAYQFMKYYGEQDIIIYDCDENEKLILFLADQLPKDKPHRIYKPSMMELALSDETFEKLLNYEMKMVQVQSNLKHSLIRLINDDEFKNAINPDCIEKLKNLTLASNDVTREEYFFDSIWRDIKNTFDLSMYHSYNNENSIVATNKFKSVIKIFIDAGVPFVDGKKLAIWSTRFARDEAARFAIKNNAVTDGMAQKYLRQILLGWPDGKLNVFFDLVKTPEPLFPIMATVFWNAMSEMFISEMKVGDKVHLFFQDSITIGNFCWDIELPIIRHNQGKIILHQYDIDAHAWKQPVEMDSPEGANIYLRRRALHLFDLNNTKLNPCHTKLEGGEKIWKQDFKDDDITKELIKWHSPKVVTLGKMKEVANKWKSACHTQNSFFSSRPTHRKGFTISLSFLGYEMDDNIIPTPCGLKFDVLKRKF